MSGSLDELILSSSSSSLVCLHDLKTGSLLSSFKSSGGSSSAATSDAALDARSKGKGRADESLTAAYRQCTDVLPTKDGLGGLVVSVVGGLGAASSSGGKAALNVWSFQKEAPLQRLVTPVKLSCIALSKTGAYLAGGGFDGRIFVWEISTGSLVASFDAHYRSVTCLAWSDDDACLVSGGDDAAAHVWSLPMMLTASNNPHLPLAPYLSLSDHTLPLTSVHLSLGAFPSLRVLTSSLDGSAKLWDLSLPSSAHHPLLSSFDLPPPEQAVRAVMDGLERTVFVATWDAKANRSKVRKVDLYRRVRRGEQDEDEEDEDGRDTGGRGRYEAIGGGGRGDHERISGASDSLPGRVWALPSPSSSGSIDRISSLHLSRLSSSLLVGTSSGAVHVLALPSLQAVRTLSPAASSGTASLSAPITFLSSLLRPPDLVSRSSAGSGSSSVGKGESNAAGGGEGVQPRTVAQQLGRNLVLPKENDDKVVPIKLACVPDVSSTILPPLASFQRTLPSSSTTAHHRHAISAGPVGVNGEDGAKMREENARLRDQLARAIAFNERMWESLVDKELGGAREKTATAPQPHKLTNGSSGGGGGDSMVVD